MNTPNHLALQEQLGFPPPVYAHVPLIFNPNGSKMSKRDRDRVVRDAAAAGGLSDERLVEVAGADAAAIRSWRAGDAQLEAESLERLARRLGVQMPEIQVHDFRVSGYLPEVLVNFIALLGWSPGADREKMTLQELGALFSLDRCGKTSARFDRDKLLAFNTDGLAAATPERKRTAFRDYLSVNPPGPLADLGDGVIDQLIALNGNARTLRDIDVKCAVLFADDDAVEYDDDAVQKHLLKNDRAGLNELQAVRATLGDAPEWTAAALDALVRAHCEKRGAALGKVAQPIRIALTGTTVSPAIFDTLELVGRERALRRMDRALARFES